MARDFPEAEKMENGLTILTRVDWEGIVAAVVADLRPEVEALRARAETAERDLHVAIRSRNAANTRADRAESELAAAQQAAVVIAAAQRTAERERDAAREELAGIELRLQRLERDTFWTRQMDAVAVREEHERQQRMREMADAIRELRAARAAAPAEEGA